MQKPIVSRRTRRQNQTLMTLQSMDKSSRCTVRSEGILGLSQSQLLAISKCSLVPCDLHLLPPLAPPYHFFFCRSQSSGISSSAWPWKSFLFQSSYYLLWPFPGWLGSSRFLGSCAFYGLLSSPSKQKTTSWLSILKFDKNTIIIHKSS